MKVNASPKRAGTRKIQDFAKNPAAASTPAAATPIAASPAPAPASAPATPNTAIPAGSVCLSSGAPAIS